MKKTVLITGAAGSLGTEIRKKLDRSKYDVICIDIVDDIAGEEWYWKVDLAADYSDYMDMMYHHGADFIIHCAATIYGVAGFNNNGYRILSRDILMTKNVLDMCNIDTKIIFLSSSMVYEKAYAGSGGVKEDQLEKYPAPSTGYGLSKYVGEAMVREWGKKSGHYTIWRPFNIITPYERAKPELGYAHVFADFFDNILIKKKNPLPIIGDGYQVRCFTWIEEVADCIVDNLENPDTNGEAFNIGNYEPITMRELATMIHDEAVARGHLPDLMLTFQTTKTFDADVLHRAPNVGKAMRSLGFEARVKTKESISILMDEWEKSLK